jgi:diguanylate cyclase (GGDEF)-like protein
MTTSSLNKLLGTEPAGHYEETRLGAEELTELLRLFLMSGDDDEADRVCLMHAPLDFPSVWAITPAMLRAKIPRLFVIHPEKKFAEARSIQSPFPFHNLLLAIVIRQGAASVLFAEKILSEDDLFRKSWEYFRVVVCDDPRLLKPLFRKLKAPLSERIKEFLNLWNPAAKAHPQFLQVLDMLHKRQQQFFEMQVRIRIRDYLVRTVPIELEGEPFFLALNRCFRQILHFDYLELQIPNPDDFWPGRGPGWVWRDTEWTGQLLSILLRHEKLTAAIREGEPVIIDDISTTPSLMNPRLLRIMGLKSGILLPLSLKSRTLGWLKIFYNQNLSITDRDISLLKYLSTSLVDVLVRSRMYLRTQRLATVDGLTSLFNHRFFHEQLRKEYQRAKRYHNSLTLIMVDVDDFKQYNDTNGHLAGDQALVTLAAVIKRTVRDIDFVARYGGEEFALILPEVDARRGLIVAEKIRRSVESETFEGEHRLKSKKITISAGVCDNALVRGPEEMIEQADQALYWVKRHGRNRCRAARKEKNARKA